MKRVLIFANGEYSPLNFYQNFIKKDDYIICADGGANQVYSAGIIPDLVVGDFDSLSEETLQALELEKTKLIKYPSEKDESDLELAVMEGTRVKPDEIVIFGALGKRLDHMFANVMLLTIPLEAGIKGYMLEEDYAVYLVDHQITINKGKQGHLSLFALSSVVEGVKTTGLKYPLVNENLYLGLSRGLSNEFTSEIATIKVKKGKLLIIKTNIK